MKKFFFFFSFFNFVFASDANNDVRNAARLRYEQSPQYQSLQQNQIFGEEGVDRQQLLGQEQADFTLLIRKECDNKLMHMFCNVGSSEEKLKLLNTLNESWMNTTIFSFEDWIIESFVSSNRPHQSLIVGAHAYKGCTVVDLNFYHYMCAKMVFSEVDVAQKLWDVNMTILEQIVLQLNEEKDVALDKVIETFIYYLGENKNLVTQLKHWKHYAIYYAHGVPVLEFFKQLYADPSQYLKFVSEEYDAEFARSFYGLS